MKYPMQHHSNPAVAVMAAEVALAYEAMVSGDIQRTATLVRLAADFEKSFFVESSGKVVFRQAYPQKAKG
jgi:hypothetical protein